VLKQGRESLILGIEQDRLRIVLTKTSPVMIKHKDCATSHLNVFTLWNLQNPVA